jgi:hypothetical protein
MLRTNPCSSLFVKNLSPEATRFGVTCGLLGTTYGVAGAALEGLREMRVVGSDKTLGFLAR